MLDPASLAIMDAALAGANLKTRSSVFQIIHTFLISQSASMANASRGKETGADGELVSFAGSPVRCRRALTSFRSCRLGRHRHDGAHRGH